MMGGARTALLSTPAPYQDYALALDFKNGVYRVPQGLLSSLSLAPGYSYTRAGAKSELNAAGVPLPFAANVPGIVPGLGYWSRGALTNLFLNSATGVTQNVTVTAQAYTLSFFGTGTITLSGTSTAGPLVGTGASNRVSLTFTPTAGTLTLTVSGSCTNVGLVAGSQPGPIIVTTGSTATVGADDLDLSFANAATDGDFVALVKMAGAITATARSLALTDGTGNNRMTINGGSTGTTTVNVTAGGVGQTGGTAVTLGSGALTLAMRVRASKTCVGVKEANTITIWAESPVISIPTTTKVEVAAVLGAQNPDQIISFVGIRRGTFSDADLSALLAAA
jgi:hypothetical protein